MLIAAQPAKTSQGYAYNGKGCSNLRIPQLVFMKNVNLLSKYIIFSKFPDRS